MEETNNSYLSLIIRKSGIHIVLLGVLAAIVPVFTEGTLLGMAFNTLNELSGTTAEVDVSPKRSLILLVIGLVALLGINLFSSISQAVVKDKLTKWLFLTDENKVEGLTVGAQKSLKFSWISRLTILLSLVAQIAMIVYQVTWVSWGVLVIGLTMQLIAGLLLVVPGEKFKISYSEVETEG